MTPHDLLIGTYTETLPHVDGKADGILAAAWADGRVSGLQLAAALRNPSWLTATPDGRFVYAVVETVEFDGAPGGAAAAFARDPESGALTLLNTVPSQGVEPAHLEVDPTGRFVVVANYRTGSVSVFERDTDGRLGARTDHVQHEGSSIDPIRQTGPHAHQIVFDPANGDLLVPDLGLDSVLVYRLDSDGRLTERPESRIRVVPGGGPRHIAFHPDGEHLFVLNELDSTLVLLRRDGAGFETVTLVSTLPEGVAVHNQTSAVRVSHSGRSVFVSNRGHDSIAIFGFDPSTHSLRLRSVEPTRGREPRDFIQSSDGSAVIVGNQDSDTIVTFAFDEDAAVLSFVDEVAAPTPVCLRLIP